MRDMRRGIVCVDIPEMIDYIPHNCKQCGGPVEKHCNETNEHFNDRECCSRACAGAYRSNKKTYEKVRCQVCSIELIKRKTESLPEYSKRITCNATVCKSAWKSRRHTSGLGFKPPPLELALRGWRVAA